MATTSWGGRDVAVLVDVSENESRLPGGCTMHLKTPAMEAALRVGVMTMAGKGEHAGGFERTRGGGVNATTSQQMRGIWKGISEQELVAPGKLGMF